MIDVETVEPSSCTGFPLPSVTEVIIVCVGDCIGVDVAITETVLPGDSFELKLVTYTLPLFGSKTGLTGP